MTPLPYVPAPTVDGSGGAVCSSMRRRSGAIFASLGSQSELTEVLQCPLQRASMHHELIAGALQPLIMRLQHGHTHFREASNDISEAKLHGSCHTRQHQGHPPLNLAKPQHTLYKKVLMHCHLNVSALQPVIITTLEDNRQ